MPLVLCAGLPGEAYSVQSLCPNLIRSRGAVFRGIAAGGLKRAVVQVGAWWSEREPSQEGTFYCLTARCQSWFWAFLSKMAFLICGAWSFWQILTCIRGGTMWHFHTCPHFGMTKLKTMSTLPLLFPETAAAWHWPPAVSRGGLFTVGFLD